MTSTNPPAHSSLAGRFAHNLGWGGGAALGGALVGSSEALYQGLGGGGALYAAALYATLWAAAGLAAAVGLAVIRRAPLRWLGAGPFSWAVAGSLGASALVLVRFIVLRDLLAEATTGRWRATAAAAGVALLVAVAALLAGRTLGKRWRPAPAGQGLLAAAPFLLFALLSQGGDDPVPSPGAVTPLAGRGVILVVVDTLRADMLGSYGAGPHRDAPPSPRIDAFAAGGTLFTDTSAQASWTKPAVASILSSRHVSGHATMAKPAVLPESLPTLASAAQEAGVKTGAVVTNYNLEESFGFARGFERFAYLPPARYLGAPSRANRLAAYNVYRLLREKLFAAGRHAEHFYRSGQRVNATAFAMLADIAAKPDDRFFLWLHYMEPHDPYFAEDGASYARVSHPHPPAEWADRMRDAYRDDIRRFDSAFGELLDGLAARGLDQRVQVVLMSDHGEEFGDHGGYYHGVTLYEEQLRVPVIVAGPGVADARAPQLARHVDIAPTVAKLLGVAAPPSWEGRDLFGDAEVPAFTIAEEDHEGNLLTAVRATAAERPFKLIRANPDNPRGLAAEELYDLAKDPNERSPLTAPAINQQLTAAFDAVRQGAKKDAATAAQRQLDADAEAELRALGYVQ